MTARTQRITELKRILQEYSAELAKLETEEANDRAQFKPGTIIEWGQRQIRRGRVERAIMRWGGVDVDYMVTRILKDGKEKTQQCIYAWENPRPATKP